MDRPRILIDTSILIDHLRKTRKDQTLFYLAASTYELAVSAVTEFEFFVGMSFTNQGFVESLIATLPILPFDSHCASQAAAIYRQLKSTNQLIALPDLFIAATAIVYNLPLLTLNQKHFQRIGHLQLQPL